MKLENKVAIVTGAASGMGKAIAELYAKEGAKVVVSDYNGEGAKVVADAIIAAGGQAIANQANVAELADIERMFEETKAAFGQLDILVNNAGIMDGMEPVGEVDFAKWNRIFAVNTVGTMQAMQIAVNIFLEQGHGVIVNNTSAAGLRGTRGGAAYTASKHAVVGLTKNTGYMYANSGIRCNAIAPGGVKTNIQNSMTGVSQFGFGRQMTGKDTMPRLGEPEEVAQLALFLGSDDSSFITGQVIVADGGWTAY
ncbi:glucose 1-dehydrogenase [Solibacillus sp. FSL R5-0449]|uniref:glucose 1-dehydrogenase n=1 Tax=Solibacillus sp. FSL R5-0449 TaxID=2921639 RepID=UPI0030CDF108